MAGRPKVDLILSENEKHQLAVCTRRCKTASEFLQFLRYIDKETFEELDIHLIMDNYGTSKTDQVKGWFNRHLRFHVHPLLDVSEDYLE